MSSFLSGIGRAIRAPGLGNRLQAALATAGGDTGAIQRLRALQLQQAELQRQNDARDAQVIGAKNMGIGNDAIAATNSQDLSWLARQRAAARMFGGAADPGGGEGDDVGTYPVDAAPQPAPGSAAPIFAPPPGAPPSRTTFASAPLRFQPPPGFPVGAAQSGAGLRTAPYSGAHWAQLAAARGIPRATSHAQAASLPRGSRFLAPDGSLREIV
jgi:hypothetical protein